MQNGLNGIMPENNMKRYLVSLWIFGILLFCSSGAHCETAEECFNRGVEHGNQGEMEKAISEFQKAIKLDPDNARSYFNLGFAYQCNGDFENAILHYSKAIEIDPNYSGAYSNRAVIYYLGRQFGKSWDDACKVEGLGGKINPEFLQDLKKELGYDTSQN